MMATTGILICLQATHGQQVALETLLREMAPRVLAEPTITAWVAARFSRYEQGMFVAFPDEGARDAYLAGPIMHAFMDQAGLLLDEGVRIQKLQIIAQQLPLSLPLQPDTKALLLTFKAPEGDADRVEEFLTDAQAFVMEEAETTAWFAIHFDESGLYGIFVTFPDGGGRLKHLVGHVPRELAKNALHLLGSMPDMDMLDVIAEKVGGAGGWG